MNRDEHRAKALELYALAEPVQPLAHPLRLSLIAEAQLHATLAITAPEPSPEIAVQFTGVDDAVRVAAAMIPDLVKPTPRKRAAAKKVAESKETTK